MHIKEVHYTKDVTVKDADVNIKKRFSQSAPFQLKSIPK